MIKVPSVSLYNEMGVRVIHTEWNMWKYFEVDSENHDRMELAVFNCPEMRIDLPLFSVYFDDSFRPVSNRTNILIFISQ